VKKMREGIVAIFLRENVIWDFGTQVDDPSPPAPQKFGKNEFHAEGMATYYSLDSIIDLRGGGERSKKNDEEFFLDKKYILVQRQDGVGKVDATGEGLRLVRFLLRGVFQHLFDQLARHLNGIARSGEQLRQCQ